MNLNLGSDHSKQTCSTSELQNVKIQHQQPALNIIYTSNNNSNNSNNTEQCGEQVFASQLDSFEMDHITLQVGLIYNFSNIQNYYRKETVDGQRNIYLSAGN